MDKNECMAKTATFIQENNFSEISKDPTEKYQRQIKKTSKILQKYSGIKKAITQISQRQIKAAIHLHFLDTTE